jgi:hypothetical protein
MVIRVAQVACPMKTLSRDDIPQIRESLRILDLVVAEVDHDLRYVWIDNPHPDFDASVVAGKRDDELAPPESVQDIMNLKRAVFTEKRPMRRIIGFHRSDGWRAYLVSAFPVCERGEHVAGVLTVGFESASGFSGMIPLCSSCHSVRDEQGRWLRLERYFEERTRSHFTHGLCPDCMHKLYPDL